MTDDGYGPPPLDVPKLELDELIDQLVVRARGVQRTQGRLRELLRATNTVAGGLSLDTVLRNIALAARELIGARYAALGVIGRHGGLDSFIHVGIDDDVAAEIGHLPQGKGLLGALITDPRPIRLAHMTDDARSSGFPASHPVMESFLGVPIDIHGEVFGNLYLTDSLHGAFSAEDEALAIALASAAAGAISNARLYQESRLQQRWLNASIEIGAQLLAASGEDPLLSVARRAIDIADADLVTVALMTADQRAVVVEVALGMQSSSLVGIRSPLSDTITGHAVSEGRALLVDGDSGSDLPRDRAHADIELGPLMILPLNSGERIRGVLTVARRTGAKPFRPSDLTMAAGFATQASVALELADARAAQQRVVLLEDRDRIARDLHDHVIQELFAVGLGLDSLAASVGQGGEIGQRLLARVDDIDRTIRRIRTSIFDLRGPLGDATPGLRAQVLETVSELTGALGFPPHVTFGGLVDFDIDAGLADDILAVVRESLTNVAKHARATRVDVDLSVADQDVTLRVVDDGVGIGQPERRSGIANLAARAERRGGTSDLATGPAGGTTLIWKAPIR